MPESLEIDLDGPVHVADHGGRGRPILLIHGLGGSHVNWSAVANPLAEAGSVRAIDLIGFGYTPLAGRSSAVDRQRDLCIDYLRSEFDEPAVLVGNSMGGLVALRIAHTAPELVDSLVLVDPALPVIRPRLDADVLKGLVLPLVPGIGPRAFERRHAAAMEDPSSYLEELYDMLFVDASRVRPEDARLALDMARRRAEMPWVTDAFVDAARSIFLILSRRRHFARWVGEVTAPALVVHGEEDRLVDVASARWLVEKNDGFDLEIFDDIGHVPQLECPDRFLSVVTPWLANRAEAATRS